MRKLKRGTALGKNNSQSENSLYYLPGISSVVCFEERVNIFIECVYFSEVGGPLIVEKINCREDTDKKRIKIHGCADFLCV